MINHVRARDMRKVKVSEDNVEDKWKDRIRVANPK